jgi:hypothetical protein
MRRLTRRSRTNESRACFFLHFRITPLAGAASGPENPAPAGPQQPVPGFRVIAVARNTKAINDRHRRVRLLSTFAALTPAARGEAGVASQMGFHQDRHQPRSHDARLAVRA